MQDLAQHLTQFGRPARTVGRNRKPHTDETDKGCGRGAVGALMSFLLLPPGWSVAEDSASSNEGSDETGIQVASWALTVPYAIGKGAFALGGAVVGSLSYLFSGGNLESAKAVWITSIDGTYVLRLAHLRGEEPIQFLGKTTAVNTSLRLIQLSLFRGHPNQRKSDPLKKLGYGSAHNLAAFLAPQPSALTSVFENGQTSI